MMLAVCCCCAERDAGENMAVPKLAAAAAVSISRRERFVFFMGGIVIPLFVECWRFLQLRDRPVVMLNPDGCLRFFEVFLDHRPRRRRLLDAEFVVRRLARKRA